MLAFREEKKGLEGETAVGRSARGGSYLSMSLRCESRRVGEMEVVERDSMMKLEAGRGAISDSHIYRVFITLVSTEATTRMNM